MDARLRDGWGLRDKRTEASAPSSGTGTDKLFRRTVLSSVDVDGGGRRESEKIPRFLYFAARSSSSSGRGGGLSTTNLVPNGGGLALPLTSSAVF